MLHLFHDHIAAVALVMMGKATGDDANPLVPELAGLTRGDAIALLDRVAEIGLLTTHGNGYYTVHPALPWFFTQHFTHTYGPPDTPRALAVTRAYCTAISTLGNHCWEQINQGRPGCRWYLAADEANLLRARNLARSHGWWDQVLGVMQGLQALYANAGRRAEWARLVDDLTSDLVDPVTDLPLPDRENQWTVFTGYRRRLAQEARDWPHAERLQRLLLSRHRQEAPMRAPGPPASSTTPTGTGSAPWPSASEAWRTSCASRATPEPSCRPGLCCGESRQGPVHRPPVETLHAEQREQAGEFVAVLAEPWDILHDQRLRRHSQVQEHAQDLGPARIAAVRT